MTRTISRRRFVAAAAAVGISAPSILRAQASIRNTSAFRIHDWREHFNSIGTGILLCDTNVRTLQHWTPDGQMWIYPTSVPLTDELTKRGYTSVVDKKVAPGWAPTPSMRARNPEWPAYVEGGAPDNPMGSHALYLGWTYYRIHGTHDTRKIGRRSSNGCIGLFNEHIAEVFARTPIGTQVKLI